MRKGDEHLVLQEAFERYPGQWVAIDRRTGRVVLARSDPNELAVLLKERGVTGVEVLRAPAVDEPELVGWG